MVKRLISDDNLVSFLKVIKLISDNSTGDVINQLDRINRLKERINNLINRIKNISITDFNGVEEAPVNDDYYARSNKQWVKLDVVEKE